MEERVHCALCNSQWPILEVKKQIKFNTFLLSLFVIENSNGSTALHLSNQWKNVNHLRWPVMDDMDQGASAPVGTDKLKSGVSLRVIPRSSDQDLSLCLCESTG